MLKNNKILKRSIFISIIVAISYFLINFIIGNEKFNTLKVLLNNEQKQLVKKYIFPYKFISEQNQKIILQSQKIFQQKLKINRLDQGLQVTKLYLPLLELDKKESLTDIEITESIIKLSNNKNLKKYKLNSGFYYGIYHSYPGSGYIDFFENNIFILSARGVLAFKKNIEDTEENFKQIKNNINNFISLNQFRDLKASLKDLFISNNKIFVSFTEEIKENCWNTSIIYGKLNYDKIIFKKLFSPQECIHSINNRDKEFYMTQSGGRIISIDKNHILLSIGDYRNRYLAQDSQSVNGKIIKINTDNNDYEIISMGHRNPQGLYFDKKNNFILETEHGPRGGDEINLIEVGKINEDEIQNYGWPISSAGEFYPGVIEGNKSIYDKYQLHKSHTEHGLIEPLKSFVPSIGISEIVKIAQNRYVVSSLKDKSLYFFELNEKNKIINLDRVEVLERVRDLRFSNNQLYLFMEDTASIGVINLN